MPSNTEITVSQLNRLVGLPDQPLLIDVRSDEDFDKEPFLIPASKRRDHATVAEWAAECRGRSTVVICDKGLKLSQGVGAWLRHLGIPAQTLEGGFQAWKQTEGLVVPAARIPARNRQGQTVWVTRARPKIDRVACPWLIRRFVDPDAVFLYVDQSEVPAVAERFNATPFDIADVFWSHEGDNCTFDKMVTEFSLQSKPMQRLAQIVRAADTDRLDLAPQAAGFLAAALGLSRMYKDDLTQLEAAMLVCDAFYRWCRDAVDETHLWVTQS